MEAGTALVLMAALVLLALMCGASLLVGYRRMGGHFSVASAVIVMGLLISLLLTIGLEVQTTNPAQIVTAVVAVWITLVILQYCLRWVGSVVAPRRTS